MNKWDIVLIPFPFTNLGTTKVRPALVISPNSAAKGDDEVFIAISSNVKAPGRYDILIGANHPEYQQSGLRFPSTIKVNKIFTIQRSSVIQTIGYLGPGLRTAVEQKLREFMELAPYQPMLPVKQTGKQPPTQT